VVNDRFSNVALAAKRTKGGKRPFAAVAKATQFNKDSRPSAKGALSA
jgi:hypothetical protein